MTDHIEATEIEYGDTPVKVIEWFKEQLKSGNHKVYVAKGWCKRCALCITFCPVKALDSDKDGVPFVYDDKCISCGSCELICPDYAIMVANLKEKKSAKKD